VKTSFQACFILKWASLGRLKNAQKEQLARKALQVTVETAGAACHELNQPIQAIMNLAEAALEGLEENHPVREDLQDIFLNIEKLAQVTQKLMSLTSYQTTSYSDETDILDLNRSFTAPDS
jgi:C4-dicarboxylate-specific signal transduction histidine kinase